MIHKADVFVAGGGLAGMITAAAFAHAGFDVVCADAAPTPLNPASSSPAPVPEDLRSTAFLQPSQAFLSEIGVWSVLEEEATPLHQMRIIDAGGAQEPPQMRSDARFEAHELSDLPFGWNLPNTVLRTRLRTHLNTLERVRLCSGVAVKGLLNRSAHARVALSDSSQVECRLAIAADGRDSGLRAAAGIGVETTDFKQTALAFCVTHPEPHQNISTEIHRSGGPFTLVPLPDQKDGTHVSAVVWMERKARAAQLLALSQEAFAAEATARSCGILGQLALITARESYPIISRHAARLSRGRVALVAEAAHVMPPIGAQGLNTSLADVALLHKLVGTRPEDPGAPSLLERYHQQRHGAMRLRQRGVGLLNRASMSGAQPLRDARNAGLRLFHALPPVRHGLMRLGMGARPNS